MIYVSCLDTLTRIIDSTGLLPLISDLPPIHAVIERGISAEQLATKIVVNLILIASLITLAGAKMRGVQAFESSLGTHASQSRTLIALKATVYLQILAACFGGLSILLADIYALVGTTLPSEAIPETLATFETTNLFLLAGATGTCLIAIVVSFISRKSLPNRLQQLPVVSIALSYFLSFWYVTEFRHPLEIAPWWAIALFPLAGSSLFVAEAFLSNVALLQKRSCSPVEFLYAAVIAVGCFLTAFGSTIPTTGLDGELLPTIMSLGVGGLGCLLAFVMLPMTCATITSWQSCRVDNPVPTNSPVMGVFQNGAAAFAIVAFIAALPLDIFAGVGTIIAAFISICMLLSRKVPMALFPLTANVTHLRERANAMLRAGLMTQEYESILCLSRHMQRQAMLTALSLMPWFLIAVISNLSRTEKLSHRLEKAYLLRLPSRSAMLLFAELLPAERTGYEDELRALGEELLPTM